jgi:tight adherence protein C
MVPLLAAATAAATIFVAAWALAGNAARRRFAARVRALERRSFANTFDADDAPGGQERRSLPMRAAAAARSLLPASLMQALERRLALAGQPMSAEWFLALQFGAILGGCLFLALALPRAGGGPMAFASLAGGAFVAGLPLYVLRLKRRARQKAILRALPDAVDLIATTVEAGLAIDASLAEVGRETRGPLGAELRNAIRETTLGRSRREALLRAIDRIGVPDVRTFLQSIVQAEMTGTPVGQVLRTQAVQMRTRRRQRAEAEAQRAPVKMIVVLVFFVLPSMLMMVLGPAIIRMSEQV